MCLCCNVDLPPSLLPLSLSLYSLSFSILSLSLSLLSLFLYSLSLLYSTLLSLSFYLSTLLYSLFLSFYSHSLSLSPPLASFPSAVLEISEDEVSEWFSPKDFGIGKTITIMGRKFLM